MPVPADAHGVRPALLADALERSGARLAYLQPTYANPTGALLDAERRQAVHEVAAAAGAFVIEDDWAHDLDLDGTAPAPLVASDDDGHVVYLRSLTKAAAPGLRLAAVAARGQAGARLRAARVVDDFFVSGVLQEAALDLLSSPAWARHLRALHRALRSRRDALAAAVRADSGSGSPSRAAGSTCGCACPTRSTTSRSPPARWPAGSSSRPAGRGSRPTRRAPTCGSPTRARRRPTSSRASADLPP